MELKPEAMTLEDAKAAIGTQIHESCGLLEKLVGAGKIHGNGRRMTQKVARFAKDLLDECWVEKRK